MIRKYVMIDKQYPVVTEIESKVQHKQMGAGRATSAGFYIAMPETKTVTTYGVSTSLDMGPAEDDARIIAKFLFGEGA